MAELVKTYDVFIAHSAKDSALALEVANACRDSALEAVTYTELLPGENLGDAIWEALAESRALVTIVSPSGPTPAMAIESGAARAWNKPIYAIVTDPASNRLDSALTGIPLYTYGRIQDVISSIKASVEEFSEDDRVILGELYSRMGTSVDQLILDPRQRETLVKKFAKSSGKVVEGERLLFELVRLRKQGRLA
jgi:TIR domain